MFDDAAWSKTNVTVTANAIAAPDGTTTADKVEAATTAATILSQNAGAVGTTTMTFSIYGKQGSGATDANVFVIRNSTTSTNLLAYTVNWTTGVVTVTGGSGSVSSVDAGNGWWRIIATVSSGITAGNTMLAYSAFAGGSETAGEFSYIWGAQLETGSTATAFQNVGTDKMSLFSGLSKVSDAAVSIVAELSLSSVTNNGSFYLAVPGSAGVGNYAFSSKGTTPSTPTAVIAAPDTAVITGLSDISAPFSTIRRNAVASTSTGSQGTGTFLSYPLYFGRRNNATLPFNGRIFQLIIRGAATDSVTVTNAEQYVAQKTGVTL